MMPDLQEVAAALGRHPTNREPYASNSGASWRFVDITRDSRSRALRRLQWTTETLVDAEELADDCVKLRVHDPLAVGIREMELDARGAGTVVLARYARQWQLRAYKRAAQNPAQGANPTVPHLDYVALAGELAHEPLTLDTALWLLREATGEAAHVMRIGPADSIPEDGALYVMHDDPLHMLARERGQETFSRVFESERDLAMWVLATRIRRRH